MKTKEKKHVMILRKKSKLYINLFSYYYLKYFLLL